LKNALSIAIDNTMGEQQPREINSFLEVGGGRP
jgi:hypothetical protein